MPLPVITNVSRVTLNWTNPDLGTYAVNVMHFECDGDDEDLAGSLDEAWNNDLFANTSSASVVETIDIQKLDGTSAGTTWPVAWAGTADSGSQVLPAVCATVTLATVLGGRSHRGRVFAPWCAEVAVASGSLGVSPRASMQAAWNSFITELPTATVAVQLVVASYTLATATDVSAALVRAPLSTQRRRQSRLA